jgi:hypothetical protein
MYEDGDTNQLFHTEFQITFLMPCKYTCHLPLFATGSPNACDKRTRSITMPNHIVNTVLKKPNKRDDIQQTAAGMNQRKLVWSLGLEKTAFIV